MNIMRLRGIAGLLAVASAALGLTVTTGAAAAAVPGTRTNAGGGAFTAADGSAWVADGSAWSDGGSKFSISRAVAGASVPEVYRTERRGARSFRVATFHRVPTAWYFTSPRPSTRQPASASSTSRPRRPR